MTAQQEGGSTPAGPFIDGHLSTCMLAASDWDKACFTASELECTCDLEGRASAYIADLREKLADALKLASGMSVHASDCATSCAPAEEPAACDCTRYEPAPLLVRSAPAGMVALNIAQQALWQYESDLRYPPNGDSVERRLSAAQTASKAVADAIAQVQPLSTPAGEGSGVGGREAIAKLLADTWYRRPVSDAYMANADTGSQAFFDQADAILAHIASTTAAAVEAEREPGLAVPENLIEQMRRLYRGLEMSAGIMRDKRRTGGWEGAERTANAFARYAATAQSIHVLLVAALARSDASEGAQP